MATAHEIEEAVGALIANPPEPETFIFELLAAYGKPKSALGRLRSGTLNRANPSSHEVCWKNQVYFKWTDAGDLHNVIDDLRTSDLAKRQNVRFVVVTDGVTFLSLDIKTGDSLDAPLVELAKHFTFFLPWAGIEKRQAKTENLADVKAAERMARLYDEIINQHLNHASGEAAGTDFNFSLNVFFSRLLFCFFAEDTGIFDRGQFINSVASHTQADGSDLDRYLDEVFSALDIENKDNFAAHLRAFPYVNGGLFGERVSAPAFNEKARSLILQCGELDWSQINPDIFGSMIQAVVHPGDRAGLGMHYTSPENIMKVISPLFLDPLREQFEKVRDSRTQLAALRQRIAEIKIFDPACGSGNFLVLSYKELRRLEHEVMVRIRDLEGEGLLDPLPYQRSMISLEHFFGIELDDFAQKIASLSLHLANHQMNLEFKKQFGADISLIPLKEAANIVRGNAARLNWNEVCENNGIDEIYVIGNPPYQGARIQDTAQKADVTAALGHIPGSGNADYVFIWFYKGGEYIRNTRARLAFVSTNSAAQGQQVALMWPSILRDTLEIGFAYTSFKWSNAARHNAGVICVVICLRNRTGEPKYLFGQTSRLAAKNINAYLLAAADIFIEDSRDPLSGLPPLRYGSFALDDGNFTLSHGEYTQIVTESPNADAFLRSFIGAKELLQGDRRYCVWISASQYQDALRVPDLARRIEKVRTWRSRSDRATTAKLADTPYRFAEIRQPDVDYWAFPTVSSERRSYLPIDRLQANVIASNQLYVIPSPDPYLFGLFSSRMHMVWIRAVGGRLKTDIRYSASLIYNSFPVPELTDPQKLMIERNVFEILDTREHHPERTLAELYDPVTMPAELGRAHSDLDEVIDRCYRTRPFANDEERLSHLFDLYEQMTARQRERAHA